MPIVASRRVTLGLFLAALALVCLAMAPLAGCDSRARPAGPAAVASAPDSPYNWGADLSVLAPNSHRLLLKLRGCQQTTEYTCGPSTLLTLARFYGGTGDEMQIAKETGCNEDTGTSVKQMVRWLNTHGFEASWSQNGSLDMLRENLGKGIPTLVHWIDWGGHWVIVIGYDTMGSDDSDDDVILFADSADTHDGCQDGITWFNAKRFNDMWFDRDRDDGQRSPEKVYISAKLVGKPGVATRAP